MSVISVMKDSFALLSKHFKARNFKTYIVNSPASINFVWAIAKAFLNEDQKSKVNFVDKSNVGPLLDYCNHHQIE